MSATPGAAVAIRSLLWLALGGWVGAWACFALLVAPVAFRVLPSAELAGKLVGPVLGSLHYAGAVAAVLVAAAGAWLERGRLLVALPLVLGAGSLVNEWVVTARITALRPLAFGAGGNPEAAAAFYRLHQVSMLVFGAVLLGAIALVVLHARRDTPRKPAAL